jgi:hypothetical protein
MVEKRASGQDFAFKVQFIKTTVEGGHAEYLIKVVGPLNISFHMIDRYSSMSSFMSTIKRNVRNTEDLPAFPGKKFFGNTSTQFLK